MPYITLPQSAQYEKFTLDDLLNANRRPIIIRDNTSNTRTHRVSDDRLEHYRLGYTRPDIYLIARKFVDFATKYQALYEVDRHTLYHTFRIPKSSGGYREINAPEPALSEALIELRSILVNDCNALYHTAAFAYVKNRKTVDAVKRHQSNNSHWFLKVDFHDFFGSTTKEFVLHMLSQIVPFNYLMATVRYREALSKALDLCFLDGKLPQGSQVSPMLTNLIMIPIDFQLTKALKSIDSGDTTYSCVYTRYADDILISSLHDFRPAVVQDVIRKVLREFDAPYTFKDEKTRYGSREGRNWNLGVMLNKDNNITVGHRAKKTFRAMLTNYILDKKNGNDWSLEDVQYMNGLLSYYKMIEPEYFQLLLDKMGRKNGVDIRAMIKKDLTA